MFLHVLWQEEIQKMISDVDDDESGTIGYEELLGPDQKLWTPSVGNHSELLVAPFAPLHQRRSFWLVSRLRCVEKVQPDMEAASCPFLYEESHSSMVPSGHGNPQSIGHRREHHLLLSMAGPSGVRPCFRNDGFSLFRPRPADVAIELLAVSEPPHAPHHPQSQLAFWGTKMQSPAARPDWWCLRV